MSNDQSFGTVLSLVVGGAAGYAAGRWIVEPWLGTRATSKHVARRSGVPIDPYAGPVDPEAGEGGRGFQVARESSRGRFTGRGPKGYVRSDERILEDVNERLEEHGDLDPSDIAVSVSRGEITLEGSVTDRWSKRLAEDLAHSVSGVRDVQNRLGIAARAAEPDIDVDVQGPASHSGTGFLTRNIEVRPRRK